MKKLLFAFLVLACSAFPCRAASLQLSIQDGKVSIDAQDVTIRQILAEWARVGKTRIVNVERLSGGPVSIQFDGVPEKQALDIILRTVPGYVAAPRETLIANASVYDTILIMATTTAVAAVRTPNPTVGGSAGPANSITQLRQSPPPSPVTLLEPHPYQWDDPAIAAAAAAGLVTIPAVQPGPSVVSAPLTMPGGISQSGRSPSEPAAAAPLNPWNAPAGTPMPVMAPLPTPATQPVMRPAPPQPDR